MHAITQQVARFLRSLLRSGSGDFRHVTDPRTDGIKHPLERILTWNLRVDPRHSEDDGL